MDMPPDLLRAALAAKGFMPTAEGIALHETALEYGRRGPILEVGSYCGKSAIFLGAAARAVGSVVVTVDHHRGSGGDQAGWGHHAPGLFDPRTRPLATLPGVRPATA